MANRVAIDTVMINDPAEYLDYFGLSKNRWATDAPDYVSTWVFRGQSDATWALLPSSLREDGRKILSPLLRLSRQCMRASLAMFRDDFDPHKDDIDFDGATDDRITDLLSQVHAEWSAIHQFLDIGDSVGHPFPGAFQLSSVDDLARWWSEPLENVENIGELSTAMVLAQHHGIPTRLLDWTMNPEWRCTLRQKVSP